MAAVTISDNGSGNGLMHTQNSVGTTWQEFILPHYCGDVVVRTSADAYVVTDANDDASVADGGTPADPDRIPLSSGTDLAVPMGSKSGANDPGRPRSLFVAAQSGTCSVYLTIVGMD